MCFKTSYYLIYLLYYIILKNINYMLQKMMRYYYCNYHINFEKG